MRVIDTARQSCALRGRNVACLSLRRMAVQESTRTILVVVVSSIKVHKVPIVKLWPRHVCTGVISYLPYVYTNVPKLRYLTQAITSDHIMNDLDINMY